MLLKEFQEAKIPLITKPDKDNKRRLQAKGLPRWRSSKESVMQETQI